MRDAANAVPAGNSIAWHYVTSATAKALSADAAHLSQVNEAPATAKAYSCPDDTRVLCQADTCSDRKFSNTEGTFELNGDLS